MLKNRSDRAKVVWSFEPGCFPKEGVQDIADKAPDAVRVVYEPGQVESVVQFLDQLSELKCNDHRLCIILDLTIASRAIVSDRTDPLELNYGEVIKVTHQDSQVNDADLTVNLQDTVEFTQVFQKGELVYFGFGKALIKISEVHEDYFQAEVEQGGLVLPAMEVHVPGTQPAPKMDVFPKDELQKLAACRVDYISAPGFTDAAELEELSEVFAKDDGTSPWLLYKINSKRAYKVYEIMLEHCKGVLVSRLELAMSVEPSVIPIISKEILQKCAEQAKISLLASEMLGSMRHNPTPTRAEVSDIANAVSDGADAVVLSEEVAFGQYSGKAITLLKRIVADMTSPTAGGMEKVNLNAQINEEMDAIAFAAFKTAKRLDAQAIVCLTKEGNTALKLASFGHHLPIIAVTFSESICTKLALVGCVDAIVLDSQPVIDDTLPQVNDLLTNQSWLKSGDKILFVSVTLSPLSRTESNLFTVQTLS